MAALILMTLSLLGLPWSPVRFAILAVAADALLLWLVARRWRTTSRPAGSPRCHPFSASALGFDALTALAVLGHGIYATLAPLGQWDFWSDWGLKAKVFWSHRGLDWAFLASPENYFAHRDYPPLLPLTLDFFSLVRGAWEDRWIGLAFTAFAAALLLVARDLLREELDSAPLASLATLALAGPALVIWIGLAEGPLIAYGCLGLWMLREGMRGGRGGWMVGALLLGGAALTKNEGMALLVAAAVAVLSLRPSRVRDLLRLWPAVALAAVWQLPRWIHGLSSELFGGALGSRLLDRWRNPGPLLAALREARWHDPWVWLGVAGAFLLFPASIRREQFLLATTGIQLLFSLFVYVVSPHPLLWHVRNSSERLVAQLTVTVAFAAITVLLPQLSKSESFGRRRASERSPARPEHS
jgi:hypothetical protein